MAQAAPSPAFNHPTPKEFAEAFGRRLKERRLAAGYTSQTALARRMSLHPMTVHKHEMQGYLPARITIEQYAYMLGCTPGYLLYGTDDPLVDLPEAVREYLTGRHAAGLHVDTRRRLIKVQWSVICGEYIDEVMVHDVRRLIDDNLRSARNSGDERPAEQLPLRHVPVSIERPRARRQPQHSGQAALAGW